VVGGVGVEVIGDVEGVGGTEGAVPQPADARARTIIEIKTRRSFFIYFPLIN